MKVEQQDFRKGICCANSLSLAEEKWSWFLIVETGNVGDDDFDETLDYM